MGDGQVKKVSRENKTASKLITMPDIGEVSATALVAKVENVDMYKKAKDFAASFGLTPKEYSSANTKKMGRISKQGDRYIRALLIHGARASIKATRAKNKHGTQGKIIKIKINNKISWLMDSAVKLWGVEYCILNGYGF